MSDPIDIRRWPEPDLPCGHPAASVRPGDGGAGTTRCCGWCADVAAMESWADLYAEADMERAQLRRERARLWVALDLTMQVLDPKRDPPAEDHGEIVAIGRAALSCAGVEPTGEDR